jgi:hypothetical protein
MDKKKNWPKKRKGRDFELSKKTIGESKKFPLQHPRYHKQENFSSNSSENMDSEDFPTLIESSEPGTNKSN